MKPLIIFIMFSMQLVAVAKSQTLQFKNSPTCRFYQPMAGLGYQKMLKKVEGHYTCDGSLPSVHLGEASAVLGAMKSPIVSARDPRIIDYTHSIATTLVLGDTPDEALSFRNGASHQLQIPGTEESVIYHRVEILQPSLVRGYWIFGVYFFTVNDRTFSLIHYDSDTNFSQNERSQREKILEIIKLYK